MHNKESFLNMFPIQKNSLFGMMRIPKKVKIATHAKFDEVFNDLLIDNLPPNCQHIIQLNGERVPIDQDELAALDLDFLCIHLPIKKMLPPW